MVTGSGHARPEPERGVDGRLERALGCMVGAAAGDAAGALLEWEGAVRPVTAAQVGWALGSGFWGVRAEQRTSPTSYYA